MALYIISWIAVGILSLGYWLQVIRIHIHKEVRDISLTYNILLAVGFGILGVTAFVGGSPIFLVKQILTTIPVVVIVFQVIYHKKDRWYDAELPRCSSCAQLCETRWKHCPYCGETRI